MKFNAENSYIVFKKMNIPNSLVLCGVITSVPEFFLEDYSVGEYIIPDWNSVVDLQYSGLHAVEAKKIISTLTELQ